MISGYCQHMSMLVNLNYFITFFQETLQYLCTHWSKPQFKSSREFIKWHTCCCSGSLRLSSSFTLWEGMQKSLSKDSWTTTTWFHCPFSCYGGLLSADNDILDSTEMPCSIALQNIYVWPLQQCCSINRIEWLNQPQTEPAQCDIMLELCWIRKSSY